MCVTNFTVTLLALRSDSSFPMVRGRAALVAYCLLSSLVLAVRGYTCPNFCSSRGLCLAQGLCTCPKGWSGPDCSIASCPLGRAWADEVAGTDNGHNLAPCSNRGVCQLDSGVCTCDAGFTGAACERTTCTCNGHGSCKSMAQFALMKDPGRGTIYSYQNNWDAQKLYGCVCDPGYSGSNCMQRTYISQ